MVAADDTLVGLTDVVRRTLLARNADIHLVEDLTQETLVKVAAARPRLSDDTLRAYAIVTARNALNHHYRRQATVKRHAHRVVEFRSLDGPEQVTLEREETDALALALDRLDAHDRELLIAHESDGTPLDELAARHHTTPRAIAMRLARARAVLRVEFVLAFRRVENISTQCRNNLIALSAGDTRRQGELHTAEHLVTCDTCAEMSKPIVQRRRGIAAWLLLAPAELARRYLASLRRSHVTQVVTIATITAAATLTYFAFANDPDSTQAATAPVEATSAPAAPAPSAAPAPTTPIDPCQPAVDASVIAADLDNCPFTLTSVTVIDVPADEGFWVTAPDGQPAWVHLVGDNESPQQIAPGQSLTMTGRIRQHTTSVDHAGAPPDQQSGLAARTAHLEVPYEQITVE